MTEHPPSKLLLIEKVKTNGRSILNCSSDEIEDFLKVIQEVSPDGAPFDDDQVRNDLLIHLTRACASIVQLHYECQHRRDRDGAFESAAMLNATLPLAFEAYKQMLAHAH